jgi:peroxiredoxin
MLRSIVVAAGVGVLLGSGSSRDDARAPAPAPVPEFLLESTKGERVSLQAERAGRLATAVVFLAEECPVSKLQAPKIGKLAKEYADQGIHFLVVDVSPGCEAKKAQAFAAAAGIEAPVLLDPMQAVAARFEVKHAATALLLDKEFKPLYRGAIDDQYSLAGRKDHASTEWLVEAIEAAIEGGAPAIDSSEPTGSPLVAPAAPVTFNEQVAPVLHRQCVDCHRKGQVGPMELLDYEDAKGWAPQIAEVISQGRMPPWHADPRYGHFENERRLTDTEKALLEKWVEGGTKEGDPKKKPKPPVFQDDGWAMGKPDMIVQIPEPQSIPADGVVGYRYVYPVDPKIKEEKWVQAVEIRPTAQDATHHVLTFYVPPGKPAISMLAGLRDGSIIGAGYFGVQVPGCRPSIYPEGTGKKIEPGGIFVFQLHYTPNGKKTSDQTRMGLRFCKTKPKQEVQTRGVFSLKLRIPPNDPHYVTTSQWTWQKPTRLITFFPHMHMRGASFRFEKLAGKGDDETREIVCDVPKYDFNWQNLYRPSEPVRFDAGDKILCTAVYDNSKGNPFNPDPGRTVIWGEQTFEEMMIGYVDYVEEQ